MRNASMRCKYACGEVFIHVLESVARKPLSMESHFKPSSAMVGQLVSFVRTLSLCAIDFQSIVGFGQRILRILLAATQLLSSLIVVNLVRCKTSFVEYCKWKCSPAFGHS